MFWFTNSVETSKLFINNTFANILCKKAPRIGSPFKAPKLSVTAYTAFKRNSTIRKI